MCESMPKLSPPSLYLLGALVFIPPRNRRPDPRLGYLRLTSSGETQIPVGSGEAVKVNRYLIQKGRERQMVLYWYQSHGRVVASEYWAKLYLVMDAIQMNRTDGALVRVISPITDSEVRAEQQVVDFAKTLLPLLDCHLPL
jgi:EpsI family protein